MNRSNINIAFVCVLAFCLLMPASGQKTGLVLSGGGAKGIAHIGFIKALEENNVRIDYIAGTSIGAIVGSLYAMGYSTEEMMALFKSEEFGRWKTGEIEAQYKFSYKDNFKTPALIDIPLISKEEKTRAQIPSYIIASQVMDFAFLELTCGANAVSARDFDSLMIPFRCVSADIYNKKPVIFSKGNLAFAVRSSMTYPIYFEPIMVDSVLLFDGGIYNNFPYEVLIEDFNPDYIIGSKVTGRSKKPDRDDLMAQLENMIMQSTNFEIPDSIGIVVESKFVDVALLDFEKADSLYETGYNAAMNMMPEILERAVFMSDEDMSQRRKNFADKIPEVKFRGIEISGVDELQEEYVRNLISKQESEINIEQLKSEYFRLVSEENIKNVYPEAVFDPAVGAFDLKLDINLESSLNLSAGGLLSFTNYNQGFLEFDYYKLSDIFNQFTSNIYLGRYYSSIRVAHRIAIPKRKTILVDLSFTENRWNYYSNDITSLFDAYFPSYILRRESVVQATAGLAVNNYSTIRGGLFIGWLRDSYFQDKSLVETEDPDNTQYLIGSAKMQIESERLNKKQFATSGKYLFASTSINTGFEYFDSESTDSLGFIENEGSGHTWLAFRLQSENYSRISKKFTIGTSLDLTFSNKDFSSNFTASSINSYSFKPTNFSKLIYAESLRANNYVGGGIKPIFSINSNLCIRGGIYLFAPLFPIENINGQVYRKDLFSEIRGIAELGAVYHTPIGPLSMGLNYFSHERRRVYYYLNFGYILFNKTGLD